MATQAGDVAVDGFRGNLQVLCELAVGHAADCFHDDLSIQVGSFLPVCCGEGLGAEAAFAGFAGKPLDTVRGG